MTHLRCVWNGSPVNSRKLVKHMLKIHKYLTSLPDKLNRQVEVKSLRHVKLTKATKRDWLSA